MMKRSNAKDVNKRGEEMTQSMSLSLRNRSFLTLGREAFIASVLLSVVAIVLAIGMWRSGSLGINTSPNTASSAATASQDTPDQLLVKLRSSGFEQSEVSRAAGQFVLVVEVGKDFRNEEITLELKRADGGVMAEMRVPAGMPVQSQEVNLQAGQYTLTVVNHPEWVCHITVQ